jgi:hypothetical protein
VYNATLAGTAGVATAAAGSGIAVTGAHDTALVIIGAGLIVSAASLILFPRSLLRRLRQR